VTTWLIGIRRRRALSWRPDTALAAYRDEGRRLAAAVKATELVERALRQGLSRCRSLEAGEGPGCYER
jgi:hypothetical protein